jgi:hypothetical protein
MGRNSKGTYLCSYIMSFSIYVSLFSFNFVKREYFTQKVALKTHGARASITSCLKVLDFGAALSLALLIDYFFTLRS